MAKRVCLDAGHYGKRNRSPGVKEYYESEAMWKLHLMLKAELERYGITVVVTRDDINKDCDLYARGACSKMSDLFLSLHSNAVGNGMSESTDHVSVYHLMGDDGTECDDVSKAFAAKIAPVIANTMGVEKYKLLTKKSSKDKNKDGLFNDNYYGVLHGARMVGTPGLILEHSFHTCTRSAKWLLDENNLRKLAKAEADCIGSFLGTEEKKGDFTLEMRNLKKGCQGEDVRALQILLIGRGYSCGKYGADGDFGSGTEKAVRAYQADSDGNLTVDGVAGKNTMGALLGVN